MQDIHDTARRVESALKRLPETRMSAVNQELIRRFVQHKRHSGLTEHSALQAVHSMRRFAEWAEVDFTEATLDHIKALVGRISNSKLKNSSRGQYLAVLKEFYKWLEGANLEYPRKVRWIKTAHQHAKRRPGDVLSQDDILSLIDHAKSVQDKAIVATLYESGARLGEFLPLRLRDVEVTKFGFDIPLFGKTGFRKVPLVDAAPFLLNWLENHALAGQPGDPIWVCTGTTNHGKPLRKEGLVVRLQLIAQRAGIQKKVNPHSFRHSRATYLANYLTEPQMCLYFGWRIGSHMPAHYVHLAGSVVKSAVLKMHGIATETDELENKLSAKVCRRCGSKSSATSRHCSRCFVPFGSKLEQLLQKQERGVVSLLDAEAVERMVNRRVEQLLRERGQPFAPRTELSANTNE